MAQIFEVHARERPREEAKIDAGADAFLVTTVDERFGAVDRVVVDGEKEFVDDVILEDAVSVGQSKDGILRFQPADPRYRLCAGIDEPNQAQTHGLALLDQRGEFAGILAETDDQTIVEPLQLVSQAPAAAKQDHSAGNQEHEIDGRNRENEGAADVIGAHKVQGGVQDYEAQDNYVRGVKDQLLAAAQFDIAVNTMDMADQNPNDHD